MASMTVKLRSIPGTEACRGEAGEHAIIVDRPAGRAGGQGLGFNGGQLLGLAIGGCLCNDLHYVAHRLGIRLASVAVDVTVTLEGEPLIATAAAVEVAVRAVEGDADIAALIQQAVAISTVSNSVSRGLPVQVSSAASRKER